MTGKLIKAPALEHYMLMMNPNIKVCLVKTYAKVTWSDWLRYFRDAGSPNELSKTAVFYRFEPLGNCNQNQGVAGSKAQMSGKKFPNLQSFT